MEERIKSKTEELNAIRKVYLLLVKDRDKLEEENMEMRRKILDKKKELNKREEEIALMKQELQELKKVKNRATTGYKYTPIEYAYVLSLKYPK